VIALIGAEVLKLRKRWATYIVPSTGIVLMGIVFLLLGANLGRGGGGADATLRFPFAFQIIDTFVFVLGSILAIAYAGAVAGADWTWGIVRVVIARGEGRVRFVLAKFIGFAIVLIIGVLIAYAAGILFTFMAGSMAGVNVRNPFSGSNLTQLFESLWRGSFVLLERCAIGFAVAMILRSQLAGAVVGIVLAIGEPIVTTILTVFALMGRQDVGGEGGGLLITGNQWFQYLPFNIGNGLLNNAGTASNPSSFALPPLPFEQAVIGTLLYLVGAIAIAAVRTNRSEIGS
jgi:ABC-type transport system involved in multi-copper enzyme maturation permease subunit